MGTTLSLTSVLTVTVYICLETHSESKSVTFLIYNKRSAAILHMSYIWSLNIYFPVNQSMICNLYIKIYKQFCVILLFTLHMIRFGGFLRYAIIHVVLSSNRRRTLDSSCICADWWLRELEEEDASQNPNISGGSPSSFISHSEL